MKMLWNKITTSNKIMKDKKIFYLFPGEEENSVI